MQISVTFALEEAPQALAIVESFIPGVTASTQQPTIAKQPPVLRLYEAMDENESPRFLEALTGMPLTFAEISKRMVDNGGQAHTVGSMRAIYRNVKRREKKLIEKGVLHGPVVQTDFSGYDEEVAGRYHLATDALNALNEFLGR